MLIALNLLGLIYVGLFAPEIFLGGLQLVVRIAVAALLVTAVAVADAAQATFAIARRLGRGPNAPPDCLDWNARRGRAYLERRMGGGAA